MAAGRFRIPQFPRYLGEHYALSNALSIVLCGTQQRDLQKTEGVVGRICDLLKAAGAYAISSGIEKITIEVLERAGKSKWLQEIPANQK